MNLKAWSFVTLIAYIGIMLVACTAPLPGEQTLATSPTAPVRAEMVIPSLASDSPLSVPHSLTPTAHTPPNPLPGSQPRPLPISIDPRIELITVIQLLAQPQIRPTHSSNYRHRVQSYFAPYANHTAVTHYGTLAQVGFTANVPIQTMLFLSNPPDLILERPLTADLLQRAGSEQALLDFLVALRVFARESQFLTFFADQEEDYRAMVTNVQNTLASVDVIGVLERFYGGRQATYSVILSPLSFGSYGPRIERPDGGYDLYSILKPIDMQQSIPIFGNDRSLTHLLWHEFSHSFVNPLTEQYAAELARYALLYEPIAEQMRHLGYTQWEICVNEHIIRAITTHLVDQEWGQTQRNETLIDELKEGFIYVPTLFKQIDRYAHARDRYPTFAAFYPEIIKVFESQALTYLGDL